jgi:hypothetical protein
MVHASMYQSHNAKITKWKNGKMEKGKKVKR